MFKKIALICACLLSLVITCSKFIAYADSTEWARVTTDNVYLYADMDTKQRLFELSKSYYVSIVGQTDTLYQVAVMPQGNADFVQIVGYVYKSDLSLVKDAPVSPIYPTVKLTVTADSAELKLSPTPNASTTCAVLNSQQLCYYGKVVSYGTTWYYARYAGHFGYVEASKVTTPNVQLHPTPLPSTPANTRPSTPSDDTPTPTEAAPTAEILLIVFVVLLAVGLTLALFLPGNIKKRNNVFEQDI